MRHRPALLARQPLPVHREPLPLRQPRQWPRRRRLWRLHRSPRPERPLRQRQQRKLRPHRQRRGERPQPRLQRRSRPESAEAIVTAKVALPLLRPRVVRTKRRLNAPPASAAKLPPRRNQRNRPLEEEQKEQDRNIRRIFSSRTKRYSIT